MFSCPLVIVFHPIFVFVDPKPFLLVVESRHSVLELIKMTETIECLSQQYLPHKNLENYAKNRRGKSDMSMLVEVTEAAVALAEMQTRKTDSLPKTNVWSQMEKLQRKWLSRQVKMVSGRDAHNRVDDYENTVLQRQNSKLCIGRSHGTN